MDDPLTAHVKANKAKQRHRKPKPKPEPDWATRAMAVLEGLPHSSEFTVDDLVMRVGPAPRRNAPGGLFQVAGKRGILHDTGNTVVSDKPAARGRRIRVWRRA